MSGNVFRLRLKGSALKQAYHRASELMDGILEHHELVTLRNRLPDLIQASELIAAFQVPAEPETSADLEALGDGFQRIDEALRQRQELIEEAQVNGAIHEAMLLGYAGAG